MEIMNLYLDDCPQASGYLSLIFSYATAIRLFTCRLEIVLLTIFSTLCESGSLGHYLNLVSYYHNNNVITWLLTIKCCNLFSTILKSYNSHFNQTSSVAASLTVGFGLM